MPKGYMDLDDEEIVIIESSSDESRSVTLRQTGNSMDYFDAFPPPPPPADRCFECCYRSRCCCCRICCCQQPTFWYYALALSLLAMVLVFALIQLNLPPLSPLYYTFLSLCLLVLSFRLFSSSVRYRRFQSVWNLVKMGPSGFSLYIKKTFGSLIYFSFIIFVPLFYIGGDIYQSFLGILFVSDINTDACLLISIVLQS